MKFDWAENWPQFAEAFGQTIYIVAIAMGVGGIVGLVLGLALYTTRRGGLLQNTAVFTVLNVLVNFIRPIPFVIFLTAVGPVTIAITGSRIGTEAFIVPAAIMASFATSRIVEQNLVALDRGMIEAARSMGASPLRIIFTVVIPEALAPLILGYTFIFVAVVDMSALAGLVGGGGLGDFALTQGYQRFDWAVTWITVLVIVALVQVVQFVGNSLARRVLHR
ncbi:methionine ABC transporter permease [Georgenia thermotolerans]|uniref:ABC transporter permease subunit n=1 Tax=Georgenia thermotolerans TaxID=527326 RepID=A0A7J5UMP9_9MICO|nr:methionine ABC transporter permease [Georgenia thermotolerans]KAE8763642.1 ABC transporter permease subunit [Georgenia thermotolerans]